MIILESNLLETTLLLLVVLILLLHWLNITVVTDVFRSGWTGFMSVFLGPDHTKTFVASTLMITTLILGFFSSAVLVVWILTLSLYFITNFTMVRGSNPLKITVLIVVVTILSLHWLNITIVTDSILSGRNFFESFIPGLGRLGLDIVKVTTLIFGTFSSPVLVIGVGIFSLHVLNIPIVTDVFRSGWTGFMSVIPGPDHTKPFVASTLMITTLILGFFSSTVLVVSVLTPSLYFIINITMVRASKPLKTTVLIVVVTVVSLYWLNITMVTDSILSGWKFIKSVIPGLIEVFGEPAFMGLFSSPVLVAGVLTFSLYFIINITMVRVSKPLATTILIIVVSVLSLHLLNFNIVTDFCLSGWNFFKSIIQELGFTEVLGEPVLMIETFFLRSVSPVVLVSGVLIISLHVLNITIVTEFIQANWNRFMPVDQRDNYAKLLGTSTLTITMFILGSFSSTFIVIGVGIFSLHVLNIPIVTDLLESSWCHFKSAITVFMVDDSKQLANAIKERSTLLAPQTGSFPVYKIPLKEKTIHVDGCRYFSFGKKSTKPNRTIVCFGATGAGKSAVITGMINHILGVKWRDSYRFKIIHEGQTTHGSSEVTVYKIYHQKGFKIDHSLTIVDTPEFGETDRGAQNNITEQLRKLFYSLHDVSEIDTVCFVVPAFLTQLTPSQKYVFGSIPSVFGKDVTENIRILVTFADDQLPPVLEAIRVSGVPCAKTKDGLPIHFKYDGSVLFTNNTGVRGMNEHARSKKLDQVLWNMGNRSMMSFFADLISIKTIKMTLTNEVLGDRRQVESSVEDLQMQVKLGLAKLEKIKETTEKVREHEAEVSQNENFEFYVIVKKPVKVDISHTGQYITNCQQCQVTCHYPCGIPNDDGKRGCSAMGSNGFCTVCPGKCFWNVHFNQKFKWEYREFKEKQTVKELKENYEEGAQEKITGQGLIKELQAEYDDVQDEVMKVIEISAKCLNRLKEMAQNPNPLSLLEYINMLIEGEKKEAKPGWNQRVDALMKMREKAENKARAELL